MGRRQLLRASGGMCAWLAPMPLLAETLRSTPSQVLGPFFPISKPADNDADLTMIAGHDTPATGQVIEVSGRVLGSDGAPIGGARIEIWQANAHGRYAHPSDDNAAPLDPHFQGSATLIADAKGNYRFKTIKPGAYPAGRRSMRPAHIHFEVTGGATRLVTQLYFAGDPWLEKDAVVRAAGVEAERLIVALAPASATQNMMRARWDIVLETA